MAVASVVAVASVLALSSVVALAYDILLFIDLTHSNSILYVQLLLISIPLNITRLLTVHRVTSYAFALSPVSNIRRYQSTVLDNQMGEQLVQGYSGYGQIRTLDPLVARHDPLPLHHVPLTVTLYRVCLQVTFC